MDVPSERRKRPDEIQNAAGTRRAKQVGRRVFAYFLLFQKVRPAASMPLTSSHSSRPRKTPRHRRSPLYPRFDLFFEIIRSRVKAPWKVL